MGKRRSIKETESEETVTAVEMNCKIYQELICDMVAQIRSERFLKQIYSILLRHIQRTGD